MKLLLLALPLAAGQALAVTVAEARMDADGDGLPDMLGQTVTIEAVATCEPGLFSESGVSFYVQDATAGINVYAFDPPSFPVQPGDLLRVTGEIAQYNGLTEIEPSSPDDYEYLGSPGAPGPVQLARHQGVSEPLEGMLLRAGDPSGPLWVTVATMPSQSGGGYNFNVWNGETAIAVRVNGTTGISVSGIEPGARLFISGIGGQYDPEPPYTTGYQLLPRYQEDLAFYTPSIPDFFHLDLLSESPFSPSAGEAILMEYGGAAGFRFTLKVFDRAGREVARLASSRAGGDVVEWDGRDDREEILPIGPYIVLLEGIAPDGGRLVTTETVVVAAGLE